MIIKKLSLPYTTVFKEFVKSPEQAEIFNAGFTYGLAEKVYIGACPAAMSKTYNDDNQVDALLQFLRIINRFDLHFHSIKRSKFIEMWMFKYEHHKILLKNNPDDNSLRAMLCGYNPEAVEIDFDLER